MNQLETLPIEVVADILSELPLESLIDASQSSRFLRKVASNDTLNPWRRPILRTLDNKDVKFYDPALKHLSVRSVVPRRNWIEVLSKADSGYILFEATLPNMQDEEWEEAFKRRFLPSWKRWKKEDSWQMAFKRLLHRLWHRSHSSCTADEAWTKYIVLNRNHSANELYGISRGFSPLAVYDELKRQNNLDYLDTQVRILVQLQDVRILAVGALKSSETAFFVNALAKDILRPPGITLQEDEVVNSLSPDMNPMVYPCPAFTHMMYPAFTPGGADQRWLNGRELLDDIKWVGNLMLVAHVVGVRDAKPAADPRGIDLLQAPLKGQFISFSWDDLWAVAPWIEEQILRKINGPGLAIA